MARWQMKFSVSNSKGTHPREKPFILIVMGSDLRVTEKERDWSFVGGSPLKISTQCMMVVKNENFMLGIIKQETENKKGRRVMPL